MVFIVVVQADVFAVCYFELVISLQFNCCLDCELGVAVCGLILVGLIGCVVWLPVV